MTGLLRSPKEWKTEMRPADLWARIRGRYQRSLAAAFFRRPVQIRNPAPLISFTFDDFPRSALWTGGAILERHGLGGTYYVSLGLMDQQSPTGTMFTTADLNPLLERGHELGCHTFDHFDAWETHPKIFEESVIANRRALDKILPRHAFKTHSYPIMCPRPGTKRRAGNYFACCRGGGQTFNGTVADLNNLSAYFIERSWGDFTSIEEVIDRNRLARGWLIFATHDVSESPTPYGCTPGYFEDTVKCALESGSRILPVADACEAVMNHPVPKSPI